MTLAEFVKSKRHVSCLESHGIATESGDLNQEGWIYGDTLLFIAGPSTGECCSVMIDRSEYSTQEMFPLEGLLYQYGIEEGFITGPRWSPDEDKKWEQLLLEAMPLSDSEDGSERHVDASLRLHKHVGDVFGENMQDEFEWYSMSDHATVYDYLPAWADFILGRKLNWANEYFKTGK